MSLRPHRSGISANTGQARSIIRSATGYDVEILSGEEEALLGYTGAMQELHLASGAFLDIGGASTEIVTFHDGTPVDFTSFPIGSLSLYRRCVKKILPEPDHSHACVTRSQRRSTWTL